MTVLNKIIETASLRIPSPNTKLKIFGYFFGFKSDIAAITSLEHKREDINIISIVVNETIDSNL